VGRPNKYNPDEICDKLNKYINSTVDPVLSEFLIDESNPGNTRFWELVKGHEGLADAIKRLQMKQEVYLVRCGYGDLPPAMAVFRLKQPQHGYTDRSEVKHDVNVGFGDELQRVIDLLGGGK
jgi:hypothetical protein